MIPSAAIFAASAIIACAIVCRYHTLCCFAFLLRFATPSADATRRAA